MKLDCDGLERRLEAFVERRLSRLEACAVREHLERCEPCRELARLAQGPAWPGLDLAPAVLARTTGPGCGRARGLLDDLADGVLGALDADLVRGHLAGCDDCACLARALSALRRDLPLLAELDPGPGFASAVVARTRWAAPGATLRARCARAWKEMVLRRPRFALEAAYVLTAIVLVVFGVPGDLLAGLSRQLRDAAAVELPHRIEGALSGKAEDLRSGVREAWRESGAPIADEARRSLTSAVAYSGRRVDAMKSFAGTLWARVASEAAVDVEETAGDGDRREETERNDDRH